MKKVLLLSAAASALIMAGGDIAPAPKAAPAAVSGWDFSGTAKLYYQTIGYDEANIDLFDHQLASANAGIQLRTVNHDVFAGIGAGFELSGLGTLDLETPHLGLVDYPMQFPSAGDLTGGWISQAYLTYGFGQTQIKVGRQELPKSLSPFAFSEDWNVFKNTFDAALIINSDLPDTTAVLAWVKRANYNSAPVIALNFSGVGFGAMNDFNALNGNDGVFMLTLLNKSIENVTLTGSYYDVDGNYIWWADAQIAVSDFNIGLQGGAAENGFTAYGAKVGTTFSGVNVALAYSTIQDAPLAQVGGTTSALYTDMAGDQLLGDYDIRWGTSGKNCDKWVLSANTEALGGNISAAIGEVDAFYIDNYMEFNLGYSTNITDDLGVSVAYVHAEADAQDQAPIPGSMTLDVLRVVGTYNF